MNKEFLTPNPHPAWAAIAGLAVAAALVTTLGSVMRGHAINEPNAALPAPSPEGPGHLGVLDATGGTSVPEASSVISGRRLPDEQTASTF